MPIPGAASLQPAASSDHGAPRRRRRRLVPAALPSKLSLKVTATLLVCCAVLCCAVLCCACNEWLNESCECKAQSMLHAAQRRQLLHQRWQYLSPRLMTLVCWV